MKKEILCKECNHLIGVETLCDTCGVNLDIYDLSLMKPPIKLEFMGTQYDFCKYQCLLKFIEEEFKKQQPKDDRFELGQTMED